MGNIQVVAFPKGTSSTVSFSCTTNTNTTLNGFSSTSDLFEGMIVTGANITDRSATTDATYIVSVDSSTSVTLNQAATGSSTASRTFQKVNYNTPTNPKLQWTTDYSGESAEGEFRIFATIDENNDNMSTFPHEIHTIGVREISINTTQGHNIVTLASGTVTSAKINIGDKIFTTASSALGDNGVTVTKIKDDNEFYVTPVPTSTQSTLAAFCNVEHNNLAITNGFTIKSLDSKSEFGCSVNFTDATCDTNHSSGLAYTRGNGATNNTAGSGNIFTKNPKIIKITGTGVNTGTSGITVGQTITGTNIDSGTTVTEIISPELLKISKDVTGTGSSITFTFTSVRNVTHTANTNIIKGLSVSGTGIASGSYIEGIGSDTVFTLSSDTTATNTNTELSFSPNLTYQDYFVLVHSDNKLKHHFAKITEFLDEDGSNDSFQFEPRLGSEIPRDTKFRVYAMPKQTFNSPVAITAGLDADLDDGLIVARPLWYFFNDSLDKDNELNHDTKYLLANGRSSNKNGCSLIRNNTSNGGCSFLTDQDYSDAIIDVSKYTLKMSLVDNLRTQDNPATHTDNEGNSGTLATFSSATYSSCFPNARRTKSDYINAAGDRLSDGPKRYIHYDFSANKTNVNDSAYDCIIKDSSQNRGAFASSKIMNQSKMMQKKVLENDLFRIRHGVFRGDFNDFFDFGVKVKGSSTGTREFTFYTLQLDLSDFLNVGDEVKVGNNIIIVNTIDAVSGDEQDITFENLYRLSTDNEFTTGFPTLNANDILYRRAWNSKDKTLLTNYPIKENRVNDLYVTLIGSDFESLEATVTSASEKNKLLTLSFDNAHYQSSSYSSEIDSSLDFFRGQYVIQVEKFVGEVELIENKKENGLNILDISGRNEFRKLLSPIINKNTLFSQDIVYSTKSPYSKAEWLGMFGEIGPTSATVELERYSTREGTPIATSSTGNTTGLAAPSPTPTAGDKIYAKHNSNTLVYVGEVESYNSGTTTITLTENCRAISAGGSGTGDDVIVKAPAIFIRSNRNRKDILFNKALSSNQVTASNTSLTGSAGKGLYFESGTKLTSTGAEGDNLVGSTLASISNSSTKANGYFISEPTSILNDNAFQCTLDDNVRSSDDSYANFDMINTLIDFSILEIKKDDNNTTVRLAPYMPVTLGRVDVNFANVRDSEFAGNTSSDATAAGGPSSKSQNTIFGIVTGFSQSGKYITFDKDYSTEMLSSSDITTDTGNNITTSNERKFHGKPLYADGIFIGFFVQAELQNDLDTIRVYVDRDNYLTTDYITNNTTQISTLHYYSDEKIHPVTGIGSVHTPSGDLQESSKLVHELNFLNGAHLHGGKIISLLDPRFNADGEANDKTKILEEAINYEQSVEGSSSHDYSFSILEKFGSPYYRVFNIEKGSFSRYRPVITNLFSDDHHLYYGKEPSRIKYYANSYKFNPAYDITSGRGLDRNIVGVGRTSHAQGKAGSWLYPYSISNASLIESRGFLPVSGSKFGDYTVVRDRAGISSADEDTWGHKPVFQYLDPEPITSKFGPNYIKDAFDLIDPKVARMFLFANSDLLPYSSTRKDSLMYSTQTRDITKYNLFCLDEPTLTNVSDVKSNSEGKSNSIVFKDSSFSSASILSSDKTVSELKRFSLMRLTEVVVDWAYNQFDPENIPDKKQIVPNLDYPFYAITSAGFATDASNYGGASNNVITKTSGTISVAADDVLVDSSGRFIGIVASSNSTTVTLDHAAIKSNAGAYYAGTIYKVTTANLTAPMKISGSGSGDTFVELTKGIHMLKGTVVMAGNHYGSASGTSWNTKYSKNLFNYHGSAPNDEFINLFIPPNLNNNGDSNLINSTYDGSTVQLSENFNFDLFRAFTLLKTSTTTATSAYNGATTIRPYNSLMPVFLDRFGIEDGGGRPVTKGTATPTSLISTLELSTTSSAEYTLVGLNLGGDTTTHDFGHFQGASGFATASGLGLYDKTADGVMLGFKLRVRGTGSNLMSIQTLHGENSVCNYVDLTGCYLVSEDIDFLDDSGSGVNSAQGTGQYTQPEAKNNGVPSEVIYVISHEINTHSTSDNNPVHRIKTDIATTSDTYYRVLQPNHVCFYDFMPKEIKLNTLSSSYTKISGESRTYGENMKDYLFHEGTAGNIRSISSSNLAGGTEAVMSMFVVVDLDAQGDNSNHDYVVIRDMHQDTLEDIIPPNTPFSMCISDGETIYETSVEHKKTSVEISGTHVFRSLVFGEHREVLGVASVSETMNLTVNGDISFNSKRAMIGCVASICDETENIIDNLLEENDIQYTLTKNTENILFQSPNFDGVPLFTAINYLLEKKNKKLVQEGSSFVIKDDDDVFFNNDISISDQNTDHQVYNYESSKSSFDKFNEIIVYGKSHKTTRKDIKSIKKVGRKTLEIFEEQLSTQKDVDDRASLLLRIHNEQTDNIKVTVGSEGLGSVRAGDKISLEIQKENLPLNTYLVLEAEHNQIGNITLTLGKYIAGIDDRLAELMLEEKKINNQIKNKNFPDGPTTLDLFDGFKITPLKLTVRKRTGNPSIALGFGTALNTDTSPLGFGEGSVTFTTFVDEELI